VPQAWHSQVNVSCKELTDFHTWYVFAAVEDETTRLAGIVNNQGRMMIVSLQRGSCFKHNAVLLPRAQRMQQGFLGCMSTTAEP
jgi:hypothetical protein